jgi:hypothetical protein
MDSQSCINRRWSGKLRAPALTAGILVVLLSHVVALSTEPSYLQLRDGSGGFGHLAGFADGGYLIWQSEGFDRPFEFPLDSVQSISRAASEKTLLSGQRTSGSASIDRAAWAIHISGQKQIVGFPMELDSHHLRWSSELLGLITLERQRALRIERLEATNSQPTEASIAEWKPRSQPSDWQLTDHGCSTSVRGAICAAALPAFHPCGYAMRIRWRGTANFVVGMGPAQPPRANQGLRQIPMVDGPEIRPGLMQDNPLAIEAWAGKLFFVQNTGKQMESATLGDFGDQSGALHLVVYPASESSPATVEILGGPRFELKRIENSPVPRLLGGPRFELKRIENSQVPRLQEIVVRNLGGFVSIDDFAVRTVDRHQATDQRARKSDLSFTDGRISSGGIVDWDIDAGTVSIQDGNSTQVIPEAQLLSARFLPADNQNLKTTGKTSSSESWEAVVAETDFPKHLQAQLWDLILRDGSRLRASLLQARERRLLVGVQGISGVLDISADSLVELVAADDSARSSRLEPPAASHCAFVGSSQFKGSLVAAPDTFRQTGVFWQPNSSRTSSELQLGVSAELHFAHAKPRVNRDATIEISAGLSRGGNNQSKNERNSRLSPDTVTAAENAAADKRNSPRLTSDAYTIELTSGDKLQISLLAMDEERIYIGSPTLPSKELPHAWVQRVIFSETPTNVVMSQQQKERLLTVPRNDVHDPPTHLLISRSGDILRGNGLSLVDGKLQLEVRGRQVQLPLEGLSELVWLHQKAWEAAPADGALSIRVEGTDSSSNVVSSLRLQDGVLIGESQILGQVEWALSQVSKVVVGMAARDRSLELRLAPAPQ